MIYFNLITGLVIFLLLCIVCFTLPGFFFINISKLKFTFWEKLFIGSSFGFIFFTLSSYFLSLMKLNFLLLPIILLISIKSLKNLPSDIKRIRLISKTRITLLAVIFFVGVMGQLLIISPSGLLQDGSLIFYSSHGHDGLWHIALMEEFKKGFPLQNPVFSENKLVNYHFFSDIAPAIFSQFGLSSLDLYFRYFPLFFSILLGATVYLLGSKIGGTFSAGVWSAIFTFFAGSFGYILTFLRSGTFSGESIFWASQIQSSIGNPPQIAAFVIVLTFIFLFSFIKEGGIPIFIMCAILAGSFIEFKAYGALIILMTLGLVGIWEIVREKDFKIFLLFLASSILSLILYIPNSISGNTFLIFEPWWFIRTMVVAPDRLDLIDWELRRQTYIAENNWKRVIQLEVTAFLIFLIGNLGMRFLGFKYFYSLIKNSLKDYYNLTLILICLISFIFPLIFLQKGVAGNTIQFFQYYLLFMGIFAGISISQLFSLVRFKIFKILLIILVIVISIPTQLGLIYNFYSGLPLAKVNPDELSALEFLRLKTNQNSIILTPPFKKDLPNKELPPPIWIWSDTSYVPALSNRTAFLADLEQLDIMGYNFAQREKAVEDIFLETDTNKFVEKIENENIDYLYFPTKLSPNIDMSKTKFKKVFSNISVEIWSIN